MRRAPDLATSDLFNVVPAPAPIGGSLNYAIELRHELSRALKRVEKSRYAVAGEMSELTGQDIAKTTLDAWTAETRSPWRFPFEYAAAFEVACDTTCLQELLARKRGSRVLVGEDVLLAELGRLAKQKAEIALRERLIKERLRGKR